MNREWPKVINGYPTKFGLSFENIEWFTDENDHNPLVIPNCPHCIMGKRGGEYRGPNRSIAHQRCESCDGSGVDSTEEPIRLFDNEFTPEKISCNKVGHVRCPKCGIGFEYYDKKAFSGKRHNCGQKLVINTKSHENA